MAARAAKHRELKNIGYELFIAALSILSIVNLVLMYVFASDTNFQYVLGIMNAVMTPIFLADFAYRFFTARSKSDYVLRGFGWADLLSSLPFPQLKVFRFFRLWRVARLFMEFGARNLVNEFIVHRAENALLTIFFLMLCVLEFGSLAVLAAERGSENANIVNAADAIWWTFVTITTVGYGDQFPVTNRGRIVAIMVMITGVGLFGTLSGYLANSFLSSPNQPRIVQDAAAEHGDLETRLLTIKRLVATQEETTAQLKAQLDEIENLLHAQSAEEDTE